MIDTEGRTFIAITPTFTPIGGVVKIFDYAVHARRLGFDVTVRCPEPVSPDLPIWQIPRLAELMGDDGVSFTRRNRVEMGSDDLLFMSRPKDVEVANRSLLTGMSPERVIHVIQNVRHVNPLWLAGSATRLLTRPMARISINTIVADLIQPWLDPRALHRVINIGHDVDHFTQARSGGLGQPLKVAYTTWKSDIGDRVAHRLADDPGFEFRAIRETVDWGPLRELYSWADVFLCSPAAEEGMYLPGIEAMASGALVVTPDVGGNMSYARPGENCLLVGYEDVESYAAALEELTGFGDDAVAAFRHSGWERAKSHQLPSEAAEFAAFLEELQPRLEDVEARLAR